MITWIPFLLLLAMVLFCASAAWIDHRRRRVPATDMRVSVIIPCYNDGATIQATLESIFSAHDSALLDVVVGNDASTDNSAEMLEDLAKRFPITVVHNEYNLGKSETLNRLAAQAQHDIILFVDADTVLNRRAMADLLARLENDPTLGAVSCPYQPLNQGWLPSLQSMDYSMITIVQGGYNLFSGLALWGGCIAVRRAAFRQAGGFSLSAITEDVDLAHKLNRIGWRVQQSMIPVKSWVPATMREWIRQKTRWTAGGFQCLFTHPAVWMKNPLHITLMTFYTFMSLNCIYVTANNLLVLTGIIQLLDTLNQFFPWRSLFPLISYFASAMILDSFWFFTAFGALNAVYVAPLVKEWRDVSKLLLVIPFMMVYFPVYVVVSLMGLGYYIRHAQRLAVREARAW